MTTQGVDFAGAKNGFGAVLHAAGKTFAMRYLASDWRGLTAAEYTNLFSQGVDIGFVSEGSGSDALGGFSAGVAAATKAQAIINANGWPNLPIYAAIDFGATGAQMAVIDQFLNGFASVVGRARTGVYGSAAVVAHCQSSGSAVWFWQTYAWSNGVVVSGIHLLQYSNGQTVGGQTVDLCEAFTSNSGFASQAGTTPTVIETDDEMKIIAVPGGTIGLVGEFYGEQFSAQNFSLGTNEAVWGPGVTNLTQDQVTTIVNEANARYLKLVADVAAAVGKLPPATVTVTPPTIDVDALATAIAGQLPASGLTQADITAGVKAFFTQAVAS